MYLWQCFAIFLVLYRSVVSGYGSSKEGKCPPLPTDRGINNCAEQLFESDNVRCYQDLECSGTQKCCDDGCDRYKCKPAIGLPVLPVIGPCWFNVSLLTLEDTECKDKNVTYCLKDGCQKCCIHTSTCSPITGRYITKDECEKQLCKEKKCPGQGEICIMDKYLRAMCVCPKGCPKNFLGGQVCGSDKVTYPNKCEVNMTACVLGARIRVVHKGKCLKNTGPGLDPCATVRCGFYSRCRVVDGNVACVCDKGCTTEYNPKCGSDGVTYPNPCGLRSASCEQMKDITVVKDGKCEILGPDPLAICDLPRDRGHGIILEMRYFFNKTMGICQGFMYHGVNGNKNNFKTQKSCHDLCFKSVKAVCSLPRIVGPCRAAYPRWYHNAIRKQCQLFIYGGCSGNANNFLAKSECEKKCDVRKVDDICSLPKQPGICLAFYPSWYYDSTSKTCKEFIYGGCMGNGNRFSSKEECNRACGFDIDFLVVPRCETPNKFNCRSIKKCIPASSRCNGKDDCGDNSDEKNCDLAVKDPCENVTCDFYSRCASFKNGKTICECPQICTRDFRAVCGSDNKTYPNLCVMQVESCKNQETISKKSDGECGKRKRSKCQQEFAAIPEGIVGAFRPRCEKDGSYSKAQCHGSTGYCWCVDELGKKLEDTVVQFKTPNCTEGERKRSKCQQELDAIPEGIVGAFIPRCEKDGSYSKAQCHSSTAYCWCVDELGKKLEDTVVQFKTPNCTEGERKRSKCQQELDAIPEGIVGAFIPRCEKDGSYSKAQCHSSTAYCWCVDELGKKLEDTVVQFKTPNCTEGERKRSKCQQELDAIPEGIVGAFIPRCEKDGSYSKAQCHSSTAYCWCVDELGKKLEDTVVQFKTPNCTEGERKRSKCQQELDAIPEGIVGAFIPRCEKDGSYSKAQCHSSTAYCWCVDELGKKLEDTVVQFKTPNCTEGERKRSKCQQELDAIPEGIVGAFIPRCEKDGSYSKAQCHSSTAYCWCVDELGKKLEDTVVQFKTPNCTEGERKRSKCQQELDAIPEGIVGAFIPRCEKDGSYSKAQCHSSTAYCWCVDELGKKLEDTVVQFKTPNCTEGERKRSKCQQELDAIPEGIVGAFIPRCEKDGSYSKAQCHSSTAYCWCVDELGKKLEDTVVQFKTPNCTEGERKRSKCQQELDAIPEGIVGAFIPRCEKDGSYSKAQCHSSTAYCWCVDELGKKLEDTVVQFKTPNCTEAVIKDPCESVTCSFYAICVPLRNGTTICDCPKFCTREWNPLCGSNNQTYSNPCMMKVESCEKQELITKKSDGGCGSRPKSKCEKERDSEVRLFAIGAYIPRCEEDGSYSRLQCYGSTGYCWCVDKLGKKLEETKVGFKRPNCIEAPPPTNKPFDICDISLCDFGRCVNVNGSATCQCNNACPRIEQPVCGSDNKTYSNLCVMDAESCEKKQHINLQYEGPCGAPPPTNKPFDICDISLCDFGRCVNVNGSATCQCNNACTFIQQPVCGSDNKTYSNLCVMDAESCEKKQHINLQYDGPCGAPPPTNKPFDICDISLCDFGRCVNVNGSATCQCNNACPRIEQPVCGSDNKTYSNLCVMDAESCEKKQHINLQYDGPCGAPPPTNKPFDICDISLCDFGRCVNVNGSATCQCNNACTFIQQPVCGSDNKTYSNLCVMDAESCEKKQHINLQYDGPCGAPPPTNKPFDICDISLCDFGRCVNVNGSATCQCNNACTFIEQPVCGSDNKTYSNLCVMDAESCEKKQHIKIQHEGPCEGPGLDPCATVRCGFYSKCRVVDGKAACVCDKGCTREYNPKCGSDGVTYPNPCVLRSASCKQMKDITVVKDGKCETTIAGVTFGDPCATVQCSFYSKCRVVDGKAACVCNKGCTRELNPKCGSDGVTYSNPCVLRSASCEQMKEITVVKDGECEREIKRCRICPASENQQVVKSFCNRLNRFGIIGTLVDIQRNASKGKLKITVNITKRYKPRKLGKSNLNKKNLVTITIVGMKEDCRCENLELNINDDYVFIGRRSKKNKLFIKGGKSFVQKADGKIVKTLWKGFKGRAKNWSYCQKFRG